MPYIPSPEDRKALDTRIDLLMELFNTPYKISPGRLNYVLTRIVCKYAQAVYPVLTYSTINEVMGTLACVTQEFYRRVAVPYETRKCKENGDVFPRELVSK